MHSSECCHYIVIPSDYLVQLDFVDGRLSVSDKTSSFKQLMSHGTVTVNIFCIAGDKREHVSLEKILQFTTSTDEEPPLGYTVQPTITFVQSSISIIPTANTCINRLTLPVPADAASLNDKYLFKMYDYAFTNACSYYGHT